MRAPKVAAHAARQSCWARRLNCQRHANSTRESRRQAPSAQPSADSKIDGGIALVASYEGASAALFFPSETPPSARKNAIRMSAN